MATENGREAAGLSGQLSREPHRFDFFQAVRLLELQLRARSPEGAHGGRRRVGGDGPPDREAVRFRALPSLGFPAGAISQLRPPRPDDPGAGVERHREPQTELGVTFLGLFGSGGTLPYHYTSLLIRRIRDKDVTLREFLDLFNHRLVSLFYRAWEKYRLPFQYERARFAGVAHDADPCTRALFCLVGLGTPGLRGRLEIDDEAFLYYGGHFAHFPRSASALGQILADYFGMPIAVQQVQGQWLYLDRAEQTSLPGAGRGFGCNNRLGVDVVVGARVWDVQSKFRLRVGPLSYAQFRGLMPDGHALRPLRQMTRTYVGPELDFDVQPVLKPDEVPWCRLEARGDGALLGWNTWVRNQPFTSDVTGPTFSGDGA
jgi:type VI secretion system protein ImpH